MVSLQGTDLTAAVPRSPGTYALVFRVTEPLLVAIGRKPRNRDSGAAVAPQSLLRHSQSPLPRPLRLVPGTYVYVGSAFGPGGLRARLARHLRPEKRPHWHVDYLTAVLRPVAIIYSADEAHQECAWVQILLAAPGTTVPMAGFGNSDCTAGCPAHLVRVQDVALLQAGDWSILWLT